MKAVISSVAVCASAYMCVSMFLQGSDFGIPLLQPAMAKHGHAVKVGDKAPDFALPSQDGSTVSLKDFLGKKNVVLYFYPKDNSMICTKEACSFRDSYKDFVEAGAEVIGVSSNDKKSHEGFAGKNELPFKLLSDEHGQLRKLYGVPSTLGVVAGRRTFVIDTDGTVRMVFDSQMDAQKHVDKALKVLSDLKRPG